MSKAPQIDHRLKKSRRRIRPLSDTERLDWLAKFATGFEYRPTPDDRDGFVALEDGDLREVIDELMDVYR